MRPHAADHKFFYGINFEFSVNRLLWEPRRITSEVRPIVGAHLGKVDFIFNPIVDTDYTGGVRNLEFIPATRLAYNLNPKWAVAVEEYSDFGPLKNFRPVSDQFQEVWGVFDHAGGAITRPALSEDEMLRLGPEELFARGFPRRPDPDAHPRAFRSWHRMVCTPPST